MRKLLAVLTLAVAPLLGGCFASLQTPTPGVDATLPAPLRNAQAALNEANLLIAAVAQITIDNLKAGIVTKEEARQTRTTLREYERKVDEVQALVRLGDIKAESQAAAVKSLITILHREVAAKARKQ